MKKYIYKNGLGNQSADLNGTDAGYTPFILSTIDLIKDINKTSFVNGKLFGNDSNVSIHVFNVLTQRVKAFKNQNPRQNEGLDLNLPKNENFYY